MDLPASVSNRSIVNKRGSRNAAARLVLALLLLTAGQLVLAGQLCHSVMRQGLAGRPDMPAHGIGRVAFAAEPCCRGGSVEPPACATARMWQPEAIASASTHAQPDHVAHSGVPPVALNMLRLSVAGSRDVASPAASIVPVHILFGRFLS
jgi:hypothetical protein